MPRYPVLVPGTAELGVLKNSGPFNVIASNISRSGMVLHANAMEDLLQTEDVLRLVFHPLIGKKPVILHGRIVWQRAKIMDTIGNFTFGVMFINTPDAEIDLIFGPAQAAANSQLLPEEYIAAH